MTLQREFVPFRREDYEEADARDVGPSGAVSAIGTWVVTIILVFIIVGVAVVAYNWWFGHY